MRPSYHASDSQRWVSFDRMPNNHFVYIAMLLPKQNASGSIDVNDVVFANLMQYIDAFNAIKD